MIAFCRYRITRHRVDAPIALGAFLQQSGLAASSMSSRDSGAKVNFDKPTSRTFCAGSGLAPHPVSYQARCIRLQHPSCR
jgi:hypothetical protein